MVEVLENALVFQTGCASACVHLKTDSLPMVVGSAEKSSMSFPLSFGLCWTIVDMSEILWMNLLMVGLDLWSRRHSSCPSVWIG